MTSYKMLPIMSLNTACALKSQAMAMSSKRRLIETGTVSCPAKLPRTSSAPSVTSHQSSPNRIKVYVRVRPINSSEEECKHKRVVNVLDDRTLIFDPDEEEEEFFFHGKVQKRRDINKKVKKNMHFGFDGVFGPGSTNIEIFEATTQNILSAVFDGYNCSVFAYGATGAGKTFTMLGNDENPGIAYRTIVQLLDHVELMKDSHKVTLGASYIEVYNEIVRDLLHPTSHPGGLHIREEGGIVILSGLKVEPIVDSNKLLSLLEAGNRLRTQHPTDRNAESSRSHAIFQIHLKMQEKGATGQTPLNGSMKLSKLSMIDLAGSERGSATSYTGIRFKEGSNINKSLLALGNCINALADGQNHIPYRDSKLTRILKDSLGGNCRTLMIANVSPAGTSYDDTYNTLKYASRARTISTKISRNVVCDKLSNFQYQRMVEDLQMKLLTMQQQLESKVIVSPQLEQWTKDVERVMSERQRLHSTHIRLQAQCKLTQWRLCRKTTAVTLIPDESDNTTTDHLAAGVSQLRARVSSFKLRLQETVPLLEANNAERDALLTRLQNFDDKTIYQMIFTYWESQVQKAVKEQEAIYYMKLNDLLQKVFESNVRSLSVTVPFMHECFSLLQCYNQVTNPMKDKLQSVINSLKGENTVTWYEEAESETELEFNEEEGCLKYFSRLHPPLDPRAIEDTDKRLEESEAVVLSKVVPLLERRTRSTPLRSIQAPTETVMKTTCRTKLVGINKENLVSRGLVKSASMNELSHVGVNDTFSAAEKRKARREGPKVNRSQPYKVTTTPFFRRKAI